MYNPVTILLAPSGDSSSATRLKVAASVLIALPAVAFVLLALGELLGGDVTGVQHIPEGAVLLLLLLAGWRYPRLTGILLLAIGAAVLLFWLVWVFTQADPALHDPAVLIGAGLVFFAPPLVAGSLLLKASGDHSAAS